MANKTTIFCTPFITPLLRFVARIILKVCGWRVNAKPFSDKKLVIIGAPHTSNWDFTLMLCAVLDTEVPLNWMGKHTIFSFPFGPLMRWLGGIPVVRYKGNNTVQNIIDIFNERDELIILLSPEGTRAANSPWKSGFYRIAAAVNVPIVLGYIDGEHKQCGFEEYYYPSGDYEKDLLEIQAFYTGIKGIKH